MVAQVFSFFEYSSQCSKRTLRLPMEPLVGMMRHPFVIPICRPEVRHTCRTLPVGNPGSCQTCLCRLSNLPVRNHMVLLPLPVCNLMGDSSCAQDRDVLIDTAHDKPQAPEGPTYHIENKGEPSLQLLRLTVETR